MPKVSQKYLDFMNSPIGDKDIDSIPGINEAMSKKLVAQGYDKAWVLLGQFLVLKKNKNSFLVWMKEFCGATNYGASLCYQCLSEWCDMYI
ncbi:Barrier-to-autointegration factor [Araneus ventricosus]|uniref:Barrier-to-autointegration factor-like protein n=1 Tax=Araneus ventricosus TaxID=182803 RepID=A0A4Y2RVF2_ARAVE|nr:Barrier-to-autointegration factor [Araneus ventricosus]